MDGDLLAIYSRGTQLTPARQSSPVSRVHQCQIEQNRAPGGGHFIFSGSRMCQVTSIGCFHLPRGATEEGMSTQALAGCTR